MIQTGAQWINNFIYNTFKLLLQLKGLIMGSGDVFSQLVLERKKLTDFEHVRSIRFALIGTFFVGPSELY